MNAATVALVEAGLRVGVYCAVAICSALALVFFVLVVCGRPA